MSPYNFFLFTTFFDEDTNYGSGDPLIPRFFAFIIDVITISLFYRFLENLPLDTIVSKWEADIFTLLATPLIILLFALIESSNFRASPGKLLVGLVTVNKKGMKLSYKRSLTRNIIKWSPYFIASIVDFSIPAVVSFWFLFTCLTIFFNWISAYDYLVGSTVSRRPSFYKPYHKADDIIIS